MQRYDPRPRRLPDPSALAAGAWSLAYAVGGTYWALGGSGYPFGSGDDGRALNILGGIPTVAGASLIAAGGAIGAVVAAAMAFRVGGAGADGILAAIGWTFAGLLTVVVPDYRVLVVAAYAPLYLVGAPFGWPPGGGFFDAFTWPVVNLFLFIAGGLLWAVATLRYTRAKAPRGANPDAAWTSPSRARRWGMWATGVAVAVPIAYALTRWAWALGIPLGITDEFLEQGKESGLWIAGAGLATVAAAGGLITTGLALRWGEVFPRWLPLIGGSSVPVLLAVVPAIVAAALVTSAGLMFVRLVVLGTIDDVFAGVLGSPTDNWAAVAPELLWPIWGVALAAAAVAYYLRRRSPIRQARSGVHRDRAVSDHQHD